MLSIKDALQQARGKLNASEDAALEAQILLCEILRCNSAWLICHEQTLLSDTQYQQYQNTIKQRQKGIPIAYITQKKDFWNLHLSINQHVLIPRNDTETVVEKVLDYIQEHSCQRVLDLGTGSGAIALSIASEYPLLDITATDVCQNALQLAQHNAQQNRIYNVQFTHSNWFANLQKKQFDIIVSNPPYIAPQDSHLQEDGLPFEPIGALVAQKEGIADIQHIIEHAKPFLHRNGAIFIEHGYQQAQSVHYLLQKKDFTQIITHKDLGGNPRCTQACT